MEYLGRQLASPRSIAAEVRRSRRLGLGGDHGRHVLEDGHDHVAAKFQERERQVFITASGSFCPLESDHAVLAERAIRLGRIGGEGAQRRVMDIQHVEQIFQARLPGVRHQELAAHGVQERDGTAWVDLSDPDGALIQELDQLFLVDQRRRLHELLLILFPPARIDGRNQAT